MNIHQLNNLQQRLLFGFLSGALALFSIYISFTSWFEIFFVALTGSVITLALFEYYRIAKAKGYQPLYKIGMGGSFLFVFSVYLGIKFPSLEMLQWIVLSICLLLAFLYYFIKGQDPFDNLAITLFGLGYLTVPLSCLVRINYFFGTEGVQDGRLWLLYLILLTKMTDTGAFFIGKRFGRHKLSPYISPNKTWEGAIGGLLSTLTVSLCFFMLSSVKGAPFHITFNQSLALGVLVSIIAQFGDLAESLLKRDVGVKDSNSKLPGLGGLLDMVDSLIFTAPIIYFFLQLQMS